MDKKTASWTNRTRITPLKTLNKIAGESTWGGYLGPGQEPRGEPPVKALNKIALESKWGGYWEATRCDDALELVKANPFALLLAYIISGRARWREGFNPHNLKFGEAFIGDFENYGMSESIYRTAKAYLAKWGFATFKTTTKGTIAKLIDTRLFKVNPPKDDGQNRGQNDGQVDRPIADGMTTNLKLNSLKSVNQESAKAFSALSKELATKARKLSPMQKGLADRMEAVLETQWVNDAGKWINRIKEELGKSEHVIAEVENAVREGRIETTPAQYAEYIWEKFA
jgi:hypothetical protein